MARARQTKTTNGRAGVLGAALCLALVGCGGGSEEQLAAANARAAQAEQERDQARSRANQAASNLKVAQDTGTQQEAEARALLEEAESKLEDARGELEDREARLDEREEDLRGRESAVKKRESTVQRTERQAEANSFEGDGTYIVGEDVQPGTYKSSGGDLCYWARLDRSDEIIANDVTQGGSSVVTIRASDAQIKVSGCGTFRKR